MKWMGWAELYAWLAELVGDDAGVPFAVGPGCPRHLPGGDDVSLVLAEWICQLESLRAVRRCQLKRNAHLVAILDEEKVLAWAAARRLGGNV